jgi:Transposase DDE domain
MTINHSLEISMELQDIMKKDILGVFYDMFPFKELETFNRKTDTRDRIYNEDNTILTMIATSLQEDKSLRNSVNIFSWIHNKNIELVEKKAKEYEEKERIEESNRDKHPGRPKTYKMRVAKSKQQEISLNTSAYSQARTRLDISYVNEVYKYTTDFSDVEVPSQWKGMEVYITDGTYLQMQDSKELREYYQVIKSNGEQMGGYPQALLQVVIQQGSGAIKHFELGNRHVSELELITRILPKIQKDTLLLADDLYSSYAIFCLIKQNGLEIIVPGKRERNYKVIEEISQGDEIVEIKQTMHPKWLSKEVELPKSILMRRLTFEDPYNPGKEYVLYTSLLDKKLCKTDIVTKYFSRWDIEISIREIKTFMDINVLRSKTPEMALKELMTALIAYNLVRKIIVKSSFIRDFSPKENIIQKCFEGSKPILIDKKGRIYSKWSPGRNGYFN